MLPTKFRFIWLKQFQRRIFFRNRPIRNKNGMWWPCLLTDREEMSNLHRGHSIDAFYQVSVVAMFVNRSDEMSNLHRGPSIDASYQVSVHLAKRSIYGRSSLKSAHFVMIHYQTWLSQAILVSDWRIF
jgi:hypothetical protein